MNISDEQLYRHAAEARDLWLGTLPNREQVPTHCFSSGFEQKMAKLIHMQQRASSKTVHRIKHGIAIALAAIIVTFSALMTVSAYREKIIAAIVTVFHELTDYRFSTDQITGAMPEAEFGYVPDGMTEVERFIQEDYCYIRFEGADGLLFELTQSLLLSGGSYQTILDTEDSTTEHFMIDGEDAVANTKNGDSTVIWSRQNVLYQLFGNLPREELIKIAQEIK